MDPFYISSSSFGSSSLPNSGNVPKPLDCLHDTPVPPFLSKTFDLVDDPRLYPIISWSDTGASFVVWDPVEFARRILPKHFKHNNLSSFVRQLNTYFVMGNSNVIRYHMFLRKNAEKGPCCQGFRKIDTDRWEFACESFFRGKRHLLKNIRRRKSLPAQQLTEESSSLSIEAEVERLQKEKIEMMQEVIDLQQQQRGTHQYMEDVNQKLQAAEDRQKQMVSSLAKVFQIPKFKKEQRCISSPPTVRKFIKHQSHDHNYGLNQVPVDNIVRDLDIQSETVPLQLHDLDLQELAQVKDPFPKEELDFNLDYDATTMVKQEDIWNSDFETVSAMPNKTWDDAGNYEYPEFGVPGGELSDFWNLADSGAENWMSGNSDAVGSIGSLNSVRKANVPLWSVKRKEREIEQSQISPHHRHTVDYRGFPRCLLGRINRLCHLTNDLVVNMKFTPANKFI
ncbi:hypothetical protein L1987_81586 [Smallanthus sonchifolius]|uniref:Uncharacterized protein n=1 Tax=Smallanthus sonchifolius TaxID=185202 RepID=A0ACB8YR25_9ASTR|nr:hypothetical protein L1987_81586 [Smallanthus sonchifolius]